MAQLYDALKEIKDEVDQMNFKIQQEEDAVAAVEANLRKQYAKNKLLVAKVAQLEIAAKLAESDYKIGVIRKESLVKQIAGMKSQIDAIQKKLDEKESGLQELADVFATKEHDLLQLERSNRAAYLEIPKVKEFIEASEECAHLADTVAKLTAELNNLKAKYGPLPGERVERNKDSNVQSIEPKQTVVVEVIQFESSLPQPTPGFTTLEDILNKFTELAEENRLLKARLERLEIANKESFAPEKNTSDKDQFTTLPSNGPFMMNQAEENKPETDFNFKEPLILPKKNPISREQAILCSKGVHVNTPPAHSPAFKKNSFPLENSFFGTKAKQTETPANPMETVISFDEGNDCLLNFNFSGSPGGSFF